MPIPYYTALYVRHRHDDIVNLSKTKYDTRKTESTKSLGSNPDSQIQKKLIFRSVRTVYEVFYSLCRHFFLLL